MSDSLARQPCLLCGSEDYRSIKTFRDGVVVGRCASCRFLYTPLRHPTPEGLFFDTDATVLRVLGRPLAAGERRHYRTPNFLNYLRLIERLAPGRRLLDVGCAQGFFLAEARRQGYEATGVEPSPTMAEYGETVLGLRILKGRLDQVDLGNSQWDAVSFTDSLEYVAEPVGALRLVRPHLAPGGVVFIKVPNGDYFSLRHRFEISFGMTWSIDEAFSPSRRVGHYNTHSLRQLVEKADLKVLEMGPCRPVDSPVWRRLTGLDLEVEAPRFVGLSGRVARRILFGLGTVEFVVTRNTSLSPSLYVLAGRKAI